MTSLERIKELLEELNREYSGWMELIKDDQELSGTYDDKMKNKIFELVFAVKELCISEEIEAEDILKELIRESKVISILKNQVDISMIYYRMLRPIQKLSCHDKELAKKMIKDIFENYILRLDYKIYERYKYLDEIYENGAKKVFSAMDRLTDYYVERLLVQKEVQIDFKEETGIEEEVCAYYAQLYEKNFKELKLNLILNKLNNLENILNQTEGD